MQKFFHLVLLNLTGGDFRILIAANVMVIAATSICWVMLSRLILNEQSWSEWLVPGVLLGFGFNTVAWGFSFQFLSGLFFLALANLLWVKSVLTGRDKLGDGAYLALAFCALCGGNGLITSTILGFGFLCAIIFSRGLRSSSLAARFCLLVWGITVLAIWLGWTSSAATEVQANDQEQYVYFAFGMLKSWLGIFAINSSFIKSLFATFILIIALGGSFLLMLRNKPGNSGSYPSLVVLPVFLSALQTVAMIVAISYSRAGMQPWSPGLELHYGYLVTALPLSAWIVILILSKGVLRNFLLGAFVLVVGFAFLTNAGWRIKAAQDEYRRGTAVAADIVSPVSADVVAQRHIKEFYWVEGEQAEIAVSNGLVLLRETRFWSPRVVD
ncbi:hypothetical protein [Trichloromonas acetexigens]|uniref:Uncharacterized protein n=1 Tax=Trichloromonas acetexigens TaxID=38815 RepID=A0A550JHM7_9BACT|nr:hypothetical protein [Desulfuromonas acetexigens]TRO82717.1 hypothetical protein FL622_05935 [Desulfuromonas acetexigens]